MIIKRGKLVRRFGALSSQDPEILPVRMARCSFTITGWITNRFAHLGFQCRNFATGIRGQSNRPGNEAPPQLNFSRLSRVAGSPRIIRKMKDLCNVSVSVVGPDGEDQRVDNFLLRRCKGVPRSHVYRILRSGEVRVNSRRVEATYRLALGDRVRIPPLRMAEQAPKPFIPEKDLPIVMEDEALLVINKPPGLAVHGGSGISFGVIEQMRAARPKLKFLELVHRLDRETSGLLLLAKKRSALTALHEQMRSGAVHKFYFALVAGNWGRRERNIVFPLKKYLTKAGEKRVNVASDGQSARTIVRPIRRYEDFSLVSAELLTGRTHQIRVHVAHLGFPIAGDDKYGTAELNKALAKRGLKRMFLHAAELRFRHPVSGVTTVLEAPLHPELQRFLDTLKEIPAAAADTLL